MKRKIIKNSGKNEDLKEEVFSQPVRIPVMSLQRLPQALLAYIANFLDIADALPYFYSNRLLSENPQRNYFRLKIHQFFPEDVQKTQEIKRGWKMHQLYKKLSDEHYARLSPDMIQLFNLIKMGRFSVAMEKIKKLMTLPPFSLATGDHKDGNYSEENFLNELMVYKRDRDGRTLINWLTALNPPGHQHFLNLLFEVLELTAKANIFGSQPGTAITMRPSLQTMLLGLKAKRMSLSILWLYALAFVCRQTDLLKKIESLPAWNKEFIGEKGISLLTCAILLDSKELFEYTTAGLTATSIQALLSKKCNHFFHFSSGKVSVYEALGVKPLQLAAILESPAMINLVLQANSTSIYLPKPDYTELLHFHIKKNNEIIVRKLLEMKADPDGCMNLDKSWVPLVTAARHGRTQMAAILIESKANVEGDDEAYIGNPLTAAAYHGNMDIVKLLVENKASVNGTGELLYGNPVCCAIDGDHPQIVEYLVEHKACLNSLCNTSGMYDDTPGRTPLKAAISANNIPLAAYLMMAGAKIGPNEFIEAAQNLQTFYSIASLLQEDQLHTLVAQAKENIFKKNDNGDEEESDSEEESDPLRKEKIWSNIMNLLFFKAPGRHTALPANHSYSMNAG